VDPLGRLPDRFQDLQVLEAVLAKVINVSQDPGRGARPPLGAGAEQDAPGDVGVGKTV
jgi:hypothetical protein